MKILEGKTLAEKLRAPLKERAQNVAAKLGRKAHLVAIGWRGDYGAFYYLNKEAQAAKKTGIDADVVLIDEKTPQEAFLKLLGAVGCDDNIDALLVPRPLPPQLQDVNIAPLFNPAQDIDGQGVFSMGRLFICKTWEDICSLKTFTPCCAMAVMRLLDYHKIALAGKRVAVIGRSNIVGGPLSKMLLCKDATVTVCHSKTKNLKEITLQNDIVISAAGVLKLVKNDMLKKGAAVIDVGTNCDNGVFCGDADFDTIKVNCPISPVPGGVGPITLACLLENIIISAERKIK